MLKSSFSNKLTEAGCDEAGRGCLAGPVVAAAVILPEDYHHEKLNDSKKLSDQQRREIRETIMNDAIAYAVSFVDAQTIDEINILNASYLAMHRAIASLNVIPELLLIDGNRFDPYPGISHRCIIKGDGKYLSIAAASILAKTGRDDYMQSIHDEYPMYGWSNNKGYPTEKHKLAILQHGQSPYHRKTFNYYIQTKIDFDG